MDKIKNFYELITLIGSNKYYILFLITLMFLSTLLDLLSLSLIFGFIQTLFNLDNSSSDTFFLNLDFFNEFKREDLLIYFTIGLISLSFLKLLSSIYIKWLINLFSFKQYAILQVKLMSAYQNMSYTDYILRSSTEYIRNIREVCSHCLSKISYFLRALTELIFLFVIILFLIFFNFKVLISIALTILPIILFYEIILKPINIKYGKKKIDSEAHVLKNIYSGILGLKEIRVLSKESFFIKNISSYANNVYEAEKRSLLIDESPRHVYEFFLISLALIISLIFVKNNQDFSTFLPTIGVFLMIGLRLLPSISVITTSLNRIGFVQYAVGIVTKDLKKYDISKKKIELNNSQVIEKIRSIKFENISFKYDNSDNIIFKNINFSIKQNSCIGIMGESGVGKTTFIDILLGLLSPYEGSIIVNDKKKVDLSSDFLGEIAYLPQEPVILDEDIKTNITLTTDKSEINLKKLNESIKQANLNKVIDELQQNIDTKIGNVGVRLSGGQNKRLALARAFYHGKNVLILDEATSSLDNKSEDYIAEQIKDLKNKYTIIIISHHFNILKYCDDIYEIRDKKINPLDKNKKN